MEELIIGLLCISLVIIGICCAFRQGASFKEKILGLLMIIVFWNILFLGICFPAYGNNLPVLIASVIYTSLLCVATCISYKMMRWCNDSKVHGLATGLFNLATITAYIGYFEAVFWITASSFLLAALATSIIIILVAWEIFLIFYYPHTLLRFFKTG